MVGTKMLKSQFNQVTYAEIAEWCNAQQYKKIEDKGDYYEVVDCTPTEQETQQITKRELLQQLKDVNDELQELDVAMMCDNGNDTTDVVIDNEVVTMTGDEIDQYHTTTMQKRATILSKLKALQ